MKPRTSSADVLSQNSLEYSTQIGFIRRAAIMHDKLNDAVEIVNYSFSYEVKFYLTSLWKISKVFQIHISTSAAARNGFYNTRNNFLMFRRFSNNL